MVWAVRRRNIVTLQVFSYSHLQTNIWLHHRHYAKQYYPQDTSKRFSIFCQFSCFIHFHAQCIFIASCLPQCFWKPTTSSRFHFYFLEPLFPQTTSSRNHFFFQKPLPLPGSSSFVCLELCLKLFWVFMRRVVISMHICIFWWCLFICYHTLCF